MGCVETNTICQRGQTKECQSGIVIMVEEKIIRIISRPRVAGERLPRKSQT